MNESIQTVGDVFDAIGGTSAVARELGVGTSTASEMKRRGRIPAEYWQELIASARRHGIAGLNADALVRMHARNQAEPRHVDPSEPNTQPATGQFTRFKHLRRNRFQSLDEINDHVRALREEWDHR